MTEGKILSGIEPSALKVPDPSVTHPQQPKVELSKSEKFLKSLFSKAAERGYTPTQIVNQCMKIDQLERKYSKTFEDLKNEFDQLGKEIVTRSGRLKETEQTIGAIQKKKAELMREYLVDEKNVREYVDARAKLSPIGFAVDDIPKIKTCLFSIKSEEYSSERIIEKLNIIGDLEARKNALDVELSAANGDLREKKAILIELRKMQQTGLSVDQIDRIRDVVSKISSRRGINTDQGMSHFENDVLKNYDLALGLEGEVMRLQETKSSLASEFEEKRKSLETTEKTVLSKLKELESTYENRKTEIQAYSDLRARGIEG
ncbi:MAG: hypothetical protein ACRDF4_03920, partial [Rhabdochlamydiaceae bacterium]